MRHAEVYFNSYVNMYVLYVAQGSRLMKYT